MGYKMGVVFFWGVEFSCFFLERCTGSYEVWLACLSVLRYILCLVDFTIFPANAKQVNSILNVMSTILGMGSGNLAHVQLPAYQKSIKQGTVVAHRKNVEELMLKMGLTISQEVVLLFDKSECLGTDSRGSHQYCVAAFHKNFSSGFQGCPAFQAGHIGPLRLMPVSDFYGYDENCRPGPGERAETKPETKE